ncbi:MAG: DEAD/DEAH box helicase family protein [Kiritimatiellae bacterium]|nr:DEAD/DEAH box helicase family protein [Kiritimatiellia bacterium]
MTPFSFLKSEWPDVCEAAEKAAAAVHPDPRAACFYARRALELAMQWLYRNDETLRTPYQENLSALIHEPTFKTLAGEAIFSKARVINTLGNQAVHSHKPVRPYDALCAVRELFHTGYWLARTYARADKPAPGLGFDESALSKAAPIPKQTLDQLQKLEAGLRERDEQLAAARAGNAALDEELKRLRAEVAAAKKASAAQPDTHDYSEAQTRDLFIDLLLREAGWVFTKPGHDTEFEVSGMPNAQGKGYVDYVLWGDDGKPLAIVEAKRTRKSAQIGQQQAKLYADCLEKQFGQRPVMFLTNGYEHWMWDDLNSPPREVQGFYKKDELELEIWRRANRKKLAEATINPAIVERHYQTRAIRRIGEAFECDGDRRALVVMATGAGKTRTVIALADLLMRCNWAKRVLFLADRVALVNQAAGAFKKFLPSASPVNLVTEKDTEGRVYVSTYPTMMRLIDEANDGQRRFGVGHFDMVVIDEAHRSVYQKYGAIFEYFDALLVGLTATPQEEIDRNTYRLFDVEDGVPTDNYSLQEAVNDHFLVPPKAVSVPLKFQREGITYDQLSEEEKERWDELEWEEEHGVPDRVEAEAVNKWLFNEDTVDKVLEHLMTHGLTVAGGDRLGKTIIFAKNQDHAEFIAERFDKNYPKLKGAFARVVHCELPYAQSLIDDFTIAAKVPHIAISVDMLDTGIDVPEVVNLVFFKLVRSKTKFWQMLGRGTRLCPDLFGPGKDKQFFYVFDYCQNLEFFKQNPEATEGGLGESLGKRLFKARLELIGQLDKSGMGVSPMIQGQDARATGEDHGRDAHATAHEQIAIYGMPTTPQELRYDVADRLRTEVAAMNPDNFVVRPKRRLIERYSQPEVWASVKEGDLTELANEVAGLPSELAPEDEEAKRFDLLVLNLQLALLRAEPAFERLRDQVKVLAGLMEEKAAIPMVQAQMPLILDVQTDAWWQDVTLTMLESMRRRLRDLVKLIDKRQRKPVYTDFEDDIGAGVAIEIPGFEAPDAFEKFKAKARDFLKAHQNHITIFKLRNNQPLTASDLDALEEVLVSNGVGNPSDMQKAKDKSHGFGLFVRSLVGLDREAAKKALAVFLNGSTLSANQIEFINLIIDHLTEQGVMEARLLYESPFTDLSPQGPDGVFTSAQVDELLALLAQVRERALA